MTARVHHSAIVVHDLLRYLFGLVSLVVVFYFGHHLKKRRSVLHELRIEARLLFLPPCTR